MLPKVEINARNLYMVGSISYVGNTPIYHILNTRYSFVMTKHLAIMPNIVIDAILSGKKTIESRFSKHKIVPFGVISVGDLVYLKPPGEDVVGQFRVNKVFYFAGLSKADFEAIFAQYGEKILSGDPAFDKQFRVAHQDCHYGSLIFIKDPERFLTSPIKIKKSDQRGWAVIE